ncbi:hypothetical protein ONZ45_g13703 [Pleurotus djamor]|nr:hypothetical protein ONZ45_g13703 [Pleurotus djamor]
MPVLPLDSGIWTRDDSTPVNSTGLGLGSIIGIAIGGTAVLCLLAIVIVVIRRYYRRKTKVVGRAQESEALVRGVPTGGKPGASHKYHYVKRSEQRESSGTVPLLADEPTKELDHELPIQYPPRHDDLVETIDGSHNTPLEQEDLTEQAPMSVTSPPDRIFFGLSTPLSSSGSTFTFAGTREAMAAVPYLRSSPPPSAAPLSAATASTAAPFSAFVGNYSGPPSAVTPSTESAYSHFSAIERFPPPPVPALPAWYTASTGGSSPNKRKHDEDEEADDAHIGRSNTFVIGQMLKSRAKKVRETPSRSYTGTSVIERADSIKSVESPLPSASSADVRRARSRRRRLSSLTIPYFFSPQHIQHVSPTSLHDVTPPSKSPPSQARLPSIGGPRPLRKKGSTLQIIPMETLSEDPGSSKSSSSYTESSGLTSVPVLVSSESIPGFTALMPHPDAAWPVTPLSSSLLPEEPFILSPADSLPSPHFPLTTAFCESLPPSASTTSAPWGLPFSSSTQSLELSHAPSSFHFAPSIHLQSLSSSKSESTESASSKESFNTTAPLWISPAKRSRSSSRCSSNETLVDGRTSPGSRDSRMSTGSGRTKLYIQTQFDPSGGPTKPEPAQQNPHSRPPSRPTSRDRPTGRVMGARMRGASQSSTASDVTRSGSLDKDKLSGPKAQVFDVGGVRTVPGMDAMLGRYHRVASMQGVVVALRQ